jgi:catechol 2,3-dioxygenase-like lactoylglutathione lyase family enzyme
MVDASSFLALDRVILDIPDSARAKSAYERLIGAQFGEEVRVSNGGVQLGKPAWAEQQGAIFSAEDYDGALKLLQRRGLPFEPVQDAPRTASGVVNGLVLGLVERSEAAPMAGDIANIDHVVISSSHLNRIVATFGGRLGLDLRLEQRVMKVAKQLFFRCQNTVFEVIVKPGLPGKGDSIWGVAWRTGDIEASHARLTGLGVGMSEVRAGMKPGTRVVTVRDPDLGTPTILIEQRARC